MQVEIVGRYPQYLQYNRKYNRRFVRAE